jgi:outer membrane lipoprotein-sorting protein
MDMRLVLLVLLATVALGQAGDDAARLIQEVAERANNPKGWNIEGSVHYAKSDFDDDPVEQFTLQMRSPGRTRFEQMGTRSPALIVCDGYSSWVYSPPLNRYRKSASVDSQLCSPIVEE